MSQDIPYSDLQQLIKNVKTLAVQATGNVRNQGLLSPTPDDVSVVMKVLLEKALSEFDSQKLYHVLLRGEK